jgi:uncharacterized protein YndB with AHSA1/START domain
MTHIERETEIDRSPEDVFEVLRDPRNLARWVTILEGVSGAPQRPLRAGDGFEQRLRVMGAHLGSRWEASNVEPPREIRYEATVRIEIPVSMVQRIRSSRNGSRVELEVEYELPGGLAGDVLDRAFVKRRTQRDAERSLRRLKRLLET